MSNKIAFKPKTTVVTVRTDAPVISDPSDHVLAAQQFRKLALKVEERLRSSAKDRAIILSVTGVDVTVGKTLMSLNLAISLARGGERRVLLIEADLWRPGIGQYLQISPALPGLWHVLEDDAVLSGAIVSLGQTGCDLLLAGKRVVGEDPVCSRKMAELLVWASSRYRFVVLDSPPLGTAAGQYLAKTSDGAAIVVGAGKTKKRNLEHALQDLGPKHVAGFILNGVREDGMLGYGDQHGSYSLDAGETPAKKRSQLSRRWIAFFVALGLTAAGGGLLNSFRPDLLRSLLKRIVPDRGVPAATGANSTALVERGEATDSVAERAAGKLDVEPISESSSMPIESARVQSLGGSPNAISRSALGQRGWVTTRHNVRTGPGTDYQVLETLPVGLEVEISELRSGWARIQTGDKDGWVSMVGLEVTAAGG